MALLPQQFKDKSIYGDGADGAFSLVANTQLAADKYATSVNTNGFDLDTANYAIYCTGVVTITSGHKIYCSAGNGSGSTAGTATTAGSFTGGSNGTAGGINANYGTNSSSVVGGIGGVGVVHTLTT